MRNQLNRRTFLRSASLAAVSMIAPPAWAAELKKLSYGETEGPHWLVPYVASAKNMWAEAGLDVQTSVFPTGRVGLDALFAGRLDCCLTTDTPFVYAAMRGLTPKIIAPYSTTNAASAIAVRSDKIQQPDDFKGKTVATLAGGGGHYFLARFLAFHKLSTHDIKIINMQPNAMVLALSRGDVDALAWDTPTARAAIAQGAGGVALLNTADSAKYFRQYCLMLATDDLVTAHPAVCDAVVAALGHAVEFIHAHPAEAAQIMATREKVSLDVAQESLDAFHHEIRFDTRMIDEFVSQAEFAIANNLAARPKADLATLFRSLLYVDGARKAVPNAVDL